MNKLKYHYTIICFLSLMGCLESYAPPEIRNQVDILVVEGFINTTDGSATVRLSKAVAISNPAKPSPETMASVTISAENGNSFLLTEQEHGFYTTQGLTLDENLKYRVNIKTKDEGEFISDYVKLKQSPALQVDWRPADEGVEILVNSYDSTGNTRYYRWDYVETWQYRANFESAFELVNGVALQRKEKDQIYNCWTTAASTSIIIGTSSMLSKDIISNFLIQFLPKGSKKLSVKYSILVKQISLSKEEFDFWQQLKKTTENLGSLFDPQPAQVLGNVHNANNSTKLVLGYFGGGAVQEKRIYIGFYELPDLLRFIDTRTQCKLDTVASSQLAGIFVNELLVAEVPLSPTVFGYTKTLSNCADCREQGGITTKPEFWP